MANYHLIGPDGQEVDTKTLLQAITTALGSVPGGAATAANQVAGPVSASQAGTDPYRNPALSNAAIAVKASPGNVYSGHFVNDGLSDAWVHLYNTAQGSVSVGTTVPSRSFKVPAGGFEDMPAGPPAAFSTAITIAASTTSTGGTAPATAIFAQLEWK